MAKTLLIVESPAKAKTIKKYVGAGYEVLASKGHIKDLPKRGGVDIENGFQETYELLEEKGKPEVVKAIRAAAKKADRVLLATDPDREGEAIAYHLMEVAAEANKDAEIRRVLQDRYERGELRKETFQLVKSMLDRFVTEEVPTSPAKRDAQGRIEPLVTPQPPTKPRHRSSPAGPTSYA